MAISVSPLLNNFPASSSSSSSSLSSIFTYLPLKSSNPRRRQRPHVVRSKNEGLTREDKKILRDRYGFDPNLILSQPPPTPTPTPTQARKGKKEEDAQIRRGRRSPAIEEAEAKPERTTHRLLQVLGGKAKRKKLLSPKGMDVRPMMEVVKGSAFDILQAAGGCPAYLRPGCWLDLYSGTGSVGIEAISRGCSEVHFVEMDPWVVSNVLRPNLEWTGFLDVSVIHTVRVENFLQQAEQFVGGEKTFDFISVTPPYSEVDYGLLMDQISKSSLVGENTFVVIEYPLRTEMLDSCGCLTKITDRRFGRTLLAIYGPKWAQKRKNIGKPFQMIAKV